MIVKETKLQKLLRK